MPYNASNLHTPHTCIYLYRLNVNMKMKVIKTTFSKYKCAQYKTYIYIHLYLCHFSSMCFVGVYGIYSEWVCPNRISISLTPISRILRSSKRLSELKISFDYFSNYNLTLETFLQVHITRSANKIALRVIWTCEKLSHQIRDIELWRYVCCTKGVKLCFSAQARSSSCYSTIFSCCRMKKKSCARAIITCRSC